MHIKIKNLKLSRKSLFITVACFLVIAFGITGMNSLAASKKEPDRKETIIKKMSVTTIPAVEEDIPVSVTGYGQANPVYITEISPQVSGRIIEKHIVLDEGGIVKKGDTLFKIDATDYEIDAEKAEIRVRLQENQIEQFKVSCEKDQGRLTAVKQNTALAKSEFSRLKTLYENDRVGTLSAVEEAEQSYNSLLDTEKSLEKTIDLYPLQIAEAQNNLADAKSDLKTARLNVKRCIVTAPFSGRIKEASIETGTYITTGTLALILADDRTLEIQVPLSDKDAFEFLGLQGGQEEASPLTSLQQIECRVETVTGNVFADFPATLHRVVKYDSNSRTIWIAVRVIQEDIGNTGISLSLMDGMFCKVFFKGKALKDTVKIPASIFNSDNTVYLVRDQKLKILPVNKIMEDGDHVYVSGEFQSRDQIITTTLANPIENTALDIINSDGQTVLNAATANAGEA
ncbi:MAG: biotin/lipoyl-binding protein [Desulfobacterales bacterium]|nr:biotin/lipoyl-binding protein [Desulfobacterales bacterium]